MKIESPVLPDKIYTISEITRLIKLELESAFPQVWIQGEVSNFHRHTSGHLYFSLKDAACQLRVVMFRAEARQIRFELKDGLLVVCRGRINVYEPRGEYQLVAEVIEPKGKGALQLAFEQMKERLRAEGLFDAKHKKRLPLLPKKVGVVTSPRGAAIVDILRTLERRFARLHVLIFPVKVQGEGAAEEIAEGIDYLGGLADLDVIIVGRGGGSIEDLWAFNEEPVARAFFRCPVPIISAVGHEVDFTIADFVADIRASTPSAAAEMVVEKEEAFVERIENLERRITQSLRYFLQERRHDVISLAQHQIFQNFKIKLLSLEQKVDDLEIRAWNFIQREQRKIAEYKSQIALFSEKAVHSIKRRLQDLLSSEQRLAGELNNLSPLNILKKGYALCWKDEDGRLVRCIEDVRKDEEMTVSFYKGEFRCQVRKVDREKLIESRVTKE
ncbi:MAG: exodeoxyribonuclease VII large subunit [Candidatus Aminicenantales bacterium]